MNLTQTIIQAGLPRPLHFLHTSDIHLSYADNRDNLRKNNLAKGRKREFDGETNSCLDFLHEAIDYASSHCDLHLDTGDVIDFVSEQNLDIVRKFLTPEKSFIAAGNHEFSRYVGEAFEDHDYMMLSYHKVQSAYPNDLTFASRQIGGLNLIALNNGYYYVTQEQINAFRQEIARGLPIVLIMHNPIFTNDLYDFCMNVKKQPCAYVMGAPDEIIDSYESDYRRRQQRTTPETRQFIDLLSQTPQLKAVLAGHLHFPFETKLFGHVPQLITDSGFHGAAREITVI